MTEKKEDIDIFIDTATKMVVSQKSDDKTKNKRIWIIIVLFIILFLGQYIASIFSVYVSFPAHMIVAFLVSAGSTLPLVFLYWYIKRSSDQYKWDIGSVDTLKNSVTTYNNTLVENIVFLGKISKSKILYEKAILSSFKEEVDNNYNSISSLMKTFKVTAVLSAIFTFAGKYISDGEGSKKTAENYKNLLEYSIKYFEDPAGIGIFTKYSMIHLAELIVFCALFLLFVALEQRNRNIEKKRVISLALALCDAQLSVLKDSTAPVAQADSQEACAVPAKQMSYAPTFIERLMKVSRKS